MKSVMDQLDSRAAGNAGPSSLSGLDAMPVEEFEDEVPAEVDPETSARYKRIRAMFKDDPRGTAALVEEFEMLAKSAFAELATADPNDARVPVMLAVFQSYNQALSKLRSFR